MGAEHEGRIEQELPEEAWCYLVHVTTARFDVAAEPANPINPIPGHAALTWLRGELQRHGYEVTEPDAEDWGWYVDVRRGDDRWLVGASGVRDAGDVHDWTFQVKKHRTLLQALLGRERTRKSDPLFGLVHELFSAGEAFQEVFTDCSG